MFNDFLPKVYFLGKVSAYRLKARLLRPGGPIVKLIVDLGPYVDGSDWPI